jgi:16S rRNA (guanine966-N2)-methyltransferase
MTSAHSVRLIAGQCKRSKLPVIEAPGLRPTADRVRVTLFNWLGADLSGWRCLDAFAGTGALGLEAASRGAAEVLLLETHPQAHRSLQATQQRLQLAQARVLRAEAVTFMRRAAPGAFELVFLDPPFAEAALRAEALQAAVRLVVPDGLVYLEGPEDIAPEALPAGLAVHRQGRAGAVHFQLFRVTGGTG